MKKFERLIVAVVYVAIMIGGWVWLFVDSSAPGSYAGPLIPPMIIINIVLFIMAIVNIEKFFGSLKKEDNLKAADPTDETDMPSSFIPKELPIKKNYKALAGAVIQIAIIIAAMIWLCCSPIGLTFSLPAFAIFTGLYHGASLCIKKFRNSLNK
ncbi:MAG: hypothetical protein K2J77_04795 [Oscillospiraceae bacterium]|nr:hypothetical protein [Oscillospiraceae bacterium]